jgi:membrane protease YdiL (CAAX protease family)
MSAERVSFLRMAALFQGGMLLGALAFGWLLGHPPWAQCDLSFESISSGIFATIKMLLFLRVIYRSPAKNLVRVQRIVRELLGRQLGACGWLDLVAVALLAGVSEEFLFRGVLESYFSRWGPLVGLVSCNVLFGICHAVTPTYAVLAALLGCYLSLTLRLTNEPNLVVPIVSHSLYDFVAFIVVRNAYRNGDSQHSPKDNHRPPINDDPNSLVLPSRE